MKDINLQSGVLRLQDFPEETTKIMVMYDSRGWAIRCYDDSGHKLTTMVPDTSQNDSGSSVTLVRRETL